MFEKNLYMKDIYPGDTREALEVFCIYEAQGEYFDITNPSKILRESIVIGEQKVPVSIEQNHCLHCGRCAESCPKQCIEKRG